MVKSRSYFEWFSQAGVEPDQKLRSAIALAGGMTNGRPVRDLHVFVALYRLNTLSSRYLNIDLDKHNYRSDKYRTDLKTDQRASPESVEFERYDIEGAILSSALLSRRSSTTLTSGDYLKSLLRECLEYTDWYNRRPFTVDFLAHHFGSLLPKFTDYPELSALPEVTALLANLRANDHTDDFQYILTFDGQRIAFRVVSVLGDYVQVNDSGLLVPRRALLTHFKDTFGGFTQDEIDELEFLINHPSVNEQQLQDFFVRHPHFFRKWDYRDVHPQVYLTRTGNPLVPDFILTDRELQKAAILELKLSSPKIVRRQRNRDRFSAAFQEARAQLLRYRDWFRDKSNRRSLKAKLGIEVYEPHLAVIVGRSSEFLDDFDRQVLSANTPDVEVVTYDDIVTFAKRRRVVIT